ncbi:TatD-related deoxyribonuclease [Paenibacillus larvae subsp. larvae DSM 25430]|uniref:TatD-related deoxyribonuclease n=1 Tax=Paenibacillus larvae subsp. larvae DSM 25430 TaxID=697284 RepID=V9W9J3_9BACL|nr:TatD-related deoxyribonuclease [Paenibacillus larvae subsp. larvae DSM 25430]AVG13392.1 TatD-related deoxyribonuclease [Paenibacillus larvae subsp. larvae DSM 25430]
MVFLKTYSMESILEDLCRFFIVTANVNLGNLPCFAGNVLPCPAFFDLSIQSEVFLTFAILCSGCTIEVSQGASDKKDLMGVEGAFCMRLPYRLKRLIVSGFMPHLGKGRGDEGGPGECLLF